MTVHYKTEGLVFKKEDRQEADRVFSVFTKEFGRVEVMGKAIRKITSKLRGGIEIFGLSEIEFIQGKNKKTLTDALFLERFRNIPNDLQKLHIAYRISEMLDSFLRGQEHDSKIWDLLSDTFAKLNSYSLPTTLYSMVKHSFFWNFMALLGHMPELSVCAVCTKTLQSRNLHFSYREGGVLCENCAIARRDGHKMNADTVKILRLLLRKDWGTLDKLKIEKKLQNELKEISDHYYSYLLSTYGKHA